jgi:hypothetical protein
MSDDGPRNTRMNANGFAVVKSLKRKSDLENDSRQLA